MRHGKIISSNQIANETINKLTTICNNPRSLELFKLSLSLDEDAELTRIYTPEIFAEARKLLEAREAEKQEKIVEGELIQSESEVK